MSSYTRPNQLKPGDHVRVVAPSCSLAIVNQPIQDLTCERFAGLGLELSFGPHVSECDDFFSSSIESRLADLHDAFADPTVDAIFAVLGGSSANQLLLHIDWELISANPKMFCGFSDITALGNALLSKTGLVSFSGPVFASLGMRDHADQMLSWLTHALFDGAAVDYEPASTWSDDPWFRKPDDRKIEPNEGWWSLRPGTAQGTLIGGNLSTLALLHGTDFMPSLDGAVLFLEASDSTDPATFDQDLASLTQQPGFEGVKGLLLGRFQRASKMPQGLLEQIIANNPQLEGLPVLANLDFGHTDPLMTIPIGGECNFTSGPAPLLRF